MDPKDTNSRKTILLADDDGNLRKFVSTLLIELGYNLIVAADGKEALEKALAFTGKIDLLLSDVEMPGMTGIELAIQLNRVRPETRILLISGLDSGMLVLNNGLAVLTQALRVGHAKRSDTGLPGRTTATRKSCAWVLSKE